ncbi:MAG TPA: methylated-DNA--[protein]-cysteine S-methyltransferase [Acidimicrobiales bacterium]|jgi:methylated-DNA-[protein]-cysteine S-methyltransferase|nr:methylated-DNA--[protein]-cysteine S-methyltransferase [Acidimicrobiales bacterium]
MTLRPNSAHSNPTDSSPDAAAPVDAADTAIVDRLRAAASATPSVPADVLSRARDAAAAAGLVDVAWTHHDTPIGPLTLAATSVGLVQIHFGTGAEGLEELAARVSPRVLEDPARLDDVRRQLDEYFDGARRDFDLPLDRQLSHGFRLDVLRELTLVPFGVVLSYRDLATRVGHPGASRAVGTAMATNPIPIVQPCHRVLRTGGALGGYGGGLDAKRWLLRHEGVLLA